MSLIREFTKIMADSRRMYRDTKERPLILSERTGERNTESENIICHGDNRYFMKALLEERDMEGKINLIYIDPPFFSKSDYDAVIRAGDKNIKHMAYADKWSKGISQYLKMLTVRLLFMKDLLADDGIICVHLDWHVVHYVKVIMDDIFGESNFVNEIIWTYKSGGTSKRHFARKHDTILMYSKKKKYKFFPLKEKSYNRQFKPYRFKGVREYRDDIGWYTMVNMKDVWNIDMVGRTSSERTGYATQKPEQLAERIIECCTEEGDICADFFCGSGTLPAVAARMGRKFICCDEGSLAVESTIRRLSLGRNAFDVYNLKPNGKSKINVKIEAETEEIPSTGKWLITVSIVSIKERGLSKTVEKSSQPQIKKVLKDDPLQMIEAWSIDFDYTGGIFHPDMTFVRTKGRIDTQYEKISSHKGNICVKIVDILGNVTYEEIRE